ncbi:SMI1/KNR4 family protein [Paenibacillus xylaniclasticus]|uniref:SMI1/KNR4 family protein n=1 Tax=Paenibacillus xylaniclasticus TaxID=588083 RepID=UPI0013DF8BA4|nr:MULTISPECIES: SMI1/KNR4 family protein [Paenibacillus]GFN33197.1 hypothetical protein PCURB6_34570 [Paenibacillus curdlanolyticus]
MGVKLYCSLSIALLCYKNEEKLERKAIFYTYNAFKDCLPERVFPFADNGGGDLFLFDYRKNVNEPTIVFLDHEETVAEEDLDEEGFAKKRLVNGKIIASILYVILSLNCLK